MSNRTPNNIGNLPPIQMPAMPEPVYTQEQAIVENVFADPLSIAHPDTVSQDVMARYLIERTNSPGPRERIHVVLTPSSVVLPKITREVVGTKPVHGWEKTDRWFISPKVAAATWLASFAIINGGALFGDIADEARQARHTVVTAMGWGPKGTFVDGTKEVPTLSTPVIITKRIGAENTPGSAEPDEKAIRAFTEDVLTAAKPGAETSVDVTALSSDNYVGDASLGVKESPLQDMADERMKSWSRALKRALPGVEINADMHQDVLTPHQLAKLTRIARRSGFTGENALTNAVSAAEAGQGSERLRAFVSKNFTAQRGVKLTASVQNPEVTKWKTVPTKTYIPAEDNSPANQNRDYHPFIGLLPFRRRRWVDVGERDVKRWKMVPGMRLLRPEIFKERLDQAWLRIRPEAIKKDGTFVDNAWAFTRKYEHLVRDERITKVIRADISGEEGDDSSLRIMFVDHQPDEATVQAYADLLTSMAAIKMKDGRVVADTVTGIFVYPSKNSGKGKHPKKIGLGIDSQYAKNVLGLIYCPLKFIELHMPSDLTSEELKKYLAHQEGAIFTAAHEAPGHGTDVAKAPMTVRRIYSATIANAHVLDGDPQAMKMAPLQGILRPLLQEKDAILPRMFKVTYPVPDLNGNIIMAEEIVGENDPRLAHAHTATIIGREPTRYANEDVSEHYAETAAATITGIPIDFKEAKISVPQIVQNGVTAAFTTGYHPDARAQRLYAEEVGGIPGTLPLEFAHRPKVTLFLGSPEDDTLLRTHIIRARRQRAPLPNELMAILVPTSRRLK